MSIRKLVLFIIGLMFWSVNFLQAVDMTEDGKTIIPDNISEAIKIDGELSEKVWQNTPISKQFMIHYPVFDKAFSQKTDIWMAYDKKCLYFAFRCYDTDPDKIKSTISQRDKIMWDDWTAVVIDAMGNKQTAYEFYVNPNGIQLDALYSAVGGWDGAPDFVWDSASKLLDDGYQAELSIPLESIRFKSGKEVKMGVVFLRRLSRSGEIAAWPKKSPGYTRFNHMVTAVYKDLKNRLKLEVLPNITYNRDAVKESADTWGDNVSTNFGAAVKYGITSSITAEATVNPDYSQVESDTFQVEVNRRYPIFYSEKRPFFMEGTDIFNFGVISQGMMRSAIHTRRIADPSWAGKLTGTAGKMAFAVLVANDNSPGRSWNYGVNPDEGKNALWGIARANYSLGRDNSLGFLYSGHHFAGGHNNVVGADLKYRLFKNTRFTLSYLYSRTDESAGDKPKNGNALNAMFQYSTSKLDAWASYERYDDDFIMKSAFINRINIGRGMFYIGPSFYPKKSAWIKKIQPYVQYSKLHDMGTKMDDRTTVLGVDMYFAKHGYLYLLYQDAIEEWLGQLFKPNYWYGLVGIQLLKALQIEVGFRIGDQIYYGPGEPFLGRGRFFTLGFVLQPSSKVTLDFDFYHNTLIERPDNKKFYSVNVYNVLTTYQFNKYFFVRAAVRYNDLQKVLLTDLLASFTLIPGTVMHLGYGSLFENKDFVNSQWTTGHGSLLNMKNSLFFKVSYLWRLK